MAILNIFFYDGGASAVRMQKRAEVKGDTVGVEKDERVIVDNYTTTTQ